MLIVLHTAAVPCEYVSPEFLAQFLPMTKARAVPYMSLHTHVIIILPLSTPAMYQRHGSLSVQVHICILVFILLNPLFLHHKIVHFLNLILKLQEHFSRHHKAF